MFVYTLPMYRKRGYGRAAVEAALKVAFEELGETTTALLMMDRNSEASAFYLSLGFQRSSYSVTKNEVPATFWTIDKEQWQASQ